MSDKNEKGKAIETRQERRGKRLEKKKERMQKHGKNLAKIYRDVVQKRAEGKNDKAQG